MEIEHKRSEKLSHKEKKLTKRLEAYNQSLTPH